MKQPIKYFSMFSGIGGFEYGMEQSDYEFECVGYSEIDKYARSIYEKHFPNHINYGDATRIDTKSLPDFDLLVGGFPCQAFSIAGKRRGFDDTRGTLFFEIARILKDKRPNYFLLENVKGLLYHNQGETFKTILEVLTDLGYNVQWEIYNSQYYGTPQRRERIFLKGFFRRECGEQVLHKQEDNAENSLKLERALVQLNNNKKTNQSSRIYSSNGLSICLNAAGNNGWYVVDEECERRIKKEHS